MYISVKLGIWEAMLAEYIESIEDITDVSCNVAEREK